MRRVIFALLLLTSGSAWADNHYVSCDLENLTKGLVVASTESIPVVPGATVQNTLYDDVTQEVYAYVDVTFEGTVAKISITSGYLPEDSGNGIRHEVLYVQTDGIKKGSEEVWWIPIEATDQIQLRCFRLSE